MEATVTVVRRFEGNCAEDNRRKERVAQKRHAKAVVAETVEAEDETPEELEFRLEKERLDAESADTVNEVEDWDMNDPWDTGYPADLGRRRPRSLQDHVDEIMSDARAAE